MFLYEITPPIPKILLINLGVFNFLDLIFISPLFLIDSIGETFFALLLLPSAER